MTQLGDVWVVVVNFDGGDANRRAVESALAQGLPQEHIVFVDNGSSDGSFEALQASHPRVVALANGANRGFGEACNQGIAHALAEGAGAVLLLNNDAVLEAGCLERLVAAFTADESVGVCGPLVFAGLAGPRVWAAGGRMTWRANLSQLVGHGREVVTADREQRDVDYVPGCAMLIRRELLESQGALDADFFAYHEDVDYCLRARAAGWRVLHVGSATCRHDAHHTTGGGYNPRRKYMMAVNSVWFLRRHGSATRWIGWFVFDVLPVPLLGLVGLANGRWRGALAKWLGHWHGLRGRRVRAEYLRRGASPLW